MSAIAVAVAGPQADEWIAALREHASDRQVRIWPDGIGNTEEIAYACVWKPPRGALAQFPKLKAIFNLGAGADHLLADPTVPAVPIARVVHDDLTQRVTAYVVLHVLLHHRRQRLYDAQQQEHVWRVHDQPAAADVWVGIMGLGMIGRAAAGALAQFGFRVAGWSRTPKHLPGVEAYHGDAALDAFLARTEILICLLPLTPLTEGILNRSLFAKLKRDGANGGAFLINAGRGPLQVDGDIVAALGDGSLAGATLDVFPQEPLPTTSPLWSHPRVTITPHNAGDISPRVFAPKIFVQIDRFERGLPLDNLVDRSRRY